MKYKLSFFYKVALTAALFVSVMSCKDTFDLAPKDVLEADQVYKSISDADAAVYGVYGKFIGLAERYVILNELRGDLMDVTFKSNSFLKELNEHAVSPSNPYINPKPFYEVILSCNDVLSNLKKMRDEGTISLLDFQERYSDIGFLRSWVYLQLGIHYGNIPYITEPITNIADLKDEALYPRITFDELITKLVTFAESLPSHEQYANGTSITTLPSGGGSVVTDGVVLSKIFIYRRMILGDLYLWANRYRDAGAAFKEIMNDAPPVIGITGTQGGPKYWTIAWGSATYERSMWGKMFTDAFNTGNATNGGYNQEWVWSIPFQKDFHKSPFIDLFSYNAGNYQLKPSELAIKSWRDVNQADETPYDPRGLDASYSIQSGFPVVRKHLGFSSLANSLNKVGIWYLNRAADLHMKIGEAANRDGKNRLAYSLLSYELKYIFDPLQGPDLYKENTKGRDMTSDWGTAQSSTKRNRSQIMKTPYAYPFNYDGSEYDLPSFARGQFSNHIGIRKRVNMPRLRIDSAKFFDMTVPGSVRPQPVPYEQPFVERTVTDAKGLMEDMEDKILDEAALELAFEGHRWQMLMRMARRRNDPSVLAKRVANKFRVAGETAKANEIEAKLMSPANWYLPFEFK